jgi:hypothetical protein
MTNIALESIDSLRLPQLQALFAEATGEETRSPNKTYLIRRIREALAAQAAEVLAEEQATVQTQDAAREAPAEKELTEAEPPAAEELATTITEEPAMLDTDAAPGTETEEEEPTTEDTPLSKLSTAELQQRYLEVVGRPTGSSHKRYLIWKIREAQKGRIPVGPRTRRSPSEPAAEHMVLPVRMETSLVQRLDEARERLGLNSRMDLFRKALAAYMTDAGETELAADLLPEA